MKIVVLVFSSTGNTLVVASRIEYILSNNGNEIDHFDGLRLIKSIHSRSNHNKQLTQYLHQFKQSLKTATVIGIASFVYSMNPPPGFYEIFDDSTLPRNLFETVKYSFTCETYGGISSSVPDILFSYLKKKNPSIQLLGQLSVHTPDSFPPYLPGKRSHDGWPPYEVSRVDSFAMNLASELTKDPIPQKRMHTLNTNTRSYTETMYQSVKDRMGTVVVDNERCIRCGRCVEVCPYNALQMHPATLAQQVTAESAGIAEREARFTVSLVDPDACLSCSRCYNWCPVHAIEFPEVHTDQRAQYQAISYTHLLSASSHSHINPETNIPLNPPHGTLPPLPFMLLRTYKGKPLQVLFPVVLFILLTIAFITYLVRKVHVYHIFTNS